MIRQRVVTYVFAALLALSGMASAQTLVTASIDDTTTWDIAGSPYHVQVSELVSTTGVLTIDPDVEVLVTITAPIVVSGLLDAMGTGEAPIRFTGSDSLTFVAGGVSSTLQYVLVDGAHIDNQGANLSLVNCTVVVPDGNALINNSGTTNITNSILWSTVPPATSTIEYRGGSVNVSYSNIQGGVLPNVTDGGGNINSDPLFVDAAIGDYSLLPYSPCVNAGDFASPNDPDGSIADMGAFPFHGIASDIVAPVTWYAGESPYYVTGVLTVRPEGALTVEPGVDVFFTQYTKLIVEGTLSAEGAATQGDSIRFLSVDPNADALLSAMMLDMSGDSSALPLPLMWFGIGVVNGGTATFEYTRVSHAWSEALLEDGVMQKPARDQNTALPEWSLASARMAKPAENGFSMSPGGGIDVSGSISKITLSNSVVTYNMGLLGGGVFVESGAEANLSDCSLRSNAAFAQGGGIYNEFASVTLTGCTLSNNAVPDVLEGTGGGLFNRYGEATVTYTVISGNSASAGAGIWSSDASWDESKHTLDIRNCTFVDNNGVSLQDSLGYTTVVNSVFWNSGNDTTHIVGFDTTMHVRYSNIQGLSGINDGPWNEGNNIDSDPLFVDPLNGDYSLGSASPCIDAGDPASPRDQDGSIADIGAFYFHQTVFLSIPAVTARSYDNIAIEIRATAWSVMSAQLELAFSDITVFDGDSLTVVYSNAFPDPSIDHNVINGVLSVSIASAAPVDLEDEVLCVIEGTLSGPFVPQQVALNWVAENVEINDAAAMQLSDGVLHITPLYGDVTDDRTVSALDVSKILKYTVKKPTELDFSQQGPTFAAADVSGNEKVSAWDGALILFRVVNPEYVFPVEGGTSPLNWVPPQQGPPKLATMTSQSGLMWARSGDGWALTTTNFDGPVGADIVLRMPESAEVSSNSAFAYSREANLVTISVASISSAAELFRVTGMPNAPVVESAMLNEVQATVAMPLEFTLHQNAPNPFNPTTTISFSIPEAGGVTLAIYDVNGRLVRTLINEQLSANTYGVVWDGTDATGRSVASGVYVYRLISGDRVTARRLTLVR